MSVLLSALCVALVVLIYDELVAPDAAPVPEIAPKAQTAMPPPPAIKTLPPLDAYAEVSQRPLFSPTRQPAPVAAPETAGNLNGFFVTSIVLDGNQRVAQIQHGRPPAIVRVIEGQTVEGWTVQSIEAERVVLQRGGTAQELKLKDRPPSQRPQGVPEPQAQPQPAPQPPPPQFPFRQQRDHG